MQTITASGFSSAIFTEAHTAPEDVPALIPSSRAKRRAVFPLQFAEYP